MLIELIGVPGCGKSTFVSSYICKHDAINPLDIFLYRKSRIKQNFNKIKLLVYMFVKYPVNCFDLFACFQKIHFRSFAKKIKMEMYMYSVLGSIVRGKKKAENMIIDEGVNQAVWGILYNSTGSEECIFELQRKLFPYFADTIIWLDEEKETVKRRLADRTGKGGAELKKDILQCESKLDEAYCLIELINTSLIDMGLDKRVIKLDSKSLLDI